MTKIRISKVQPTVENAGLLTIAEVAIMLRVDGTTVRRWVKQGVLDAVILPRVNKRHCYRIKKTTIEKLLADHPLAA